MSNKKNYPCQNNAMRCTADQDRQRLGRRSMPGTDKDLQKFGCRNSII